MAMFVIDAVAGPQVMTTRLWHEAEYMRLSRSVFVNHIDRENASFDVIMENVVLDESYRLTGSEPGFPQLFRFFDIGRIFSCATALGLVRAAMGYRSRITDSV